MSGVSRSDERKTWRFLSNHTQVLLCIARDPEVRLRDIAQAVGITERATQRIVSDLIESGHVESVRVGRRSHYTVNRELAMRHPAQGPYEIGDLLDLLTLTAEPLGRAPEQPSSSS